MHVWRRSWIVTALQLHAASALALQVLHGLIKRPLWGSCLKMRKGHMGNRIFINHRMSSLTRIQSVVHKGRLQSRKHPYTVIPSFFYDVLPMETKN